MSTSFIPAEPQPQQTGHAQLSVLTSTFPGEALATSIAESSSADFWVDWIAPEHFQEWLDSGVHPDIIHANVRTLFDTAADPHTPEATYPIAEFLNWNVTRFGQRARVTARAWICQGVEPAAGQRMAWGCCKLDCPRIADRKPLKYEHPKGEPTRAFFLEVPQCPKLWLEALANPAIPIIICEGAKKAGSLLSLGYVAIGLPGIFNGYRKQTQQLIPDLSQFAISGRDVYICFDRDLNAKTIQNVNLAIRKLGTLFAKAGCSVKVISLPGPEKGVDDFVVAQGRDAFDKLYCDALPLDFWHSSKLWQLTYKPALNLNQRYLGALPFPNSGFAFIKSPKGTGKTKALEPLILEATRNGRKVLVITHRIQLGRAICSGIGIDWIEEMHKSDTRGLLGYGLCIDSLHPDSQARFNPQEWREAIVIFDELEQVTWHILNSSTCSLARVKILECLKELMQVVISTGGLVIGQDADLSDASVQYLLGLSPIQLEPWIVVNEWKPEQGSDIFFYDTPDPAPMVAQMQAAIETGPIFVCLDSQKVKSRWSSVNLEAYLKNLFPDKRILRIDSQSITEPGHPACGLVARLNEVAIHYDIILATPTIGTGISIDVQGHFVAVFGLFQGVTPDSESRQALARVRESVPRYVWARSFSPGKIGNGSCNYWEVVKSTTQSLRHNLQLLRDFDFDLDGACDPITLRTWAKMAARVNTSLWDFREELHQGLAAEGHRVVLLLKTDVPASSPIKEAVVVIQERHKQAEAQQVANAPEITESEYLALKDKRSKSADERYTERKYALHQRYGVEVTPELKLQDDEGWYAKIRLHYYLQGEIEWVNQRDVRELNGHLERGGNKIALQDVRLLSAQVQALACLGIPELLAPHLEIRATDLLVQTIAAQSIRYRSDIKTILHLTVTEEMSEIQIVQALLNKLGVKLQCVRQERSPDGTRNRVYRYTPPNDRREAIFAAWQKRESPVAAHPPIVIDQIISKGAESHQNLPVLVATSNL